MSTILVPYHLDEHLPELNIPVPGPHSVVRTGLPGGDVWTRLAALYEQVAEAVRGAGARPAVVSGDCTVSLGVVAGVQRTGVRPGVVWFDAHGDVQTLETTTTGYIGGLPLRLLSGYRPELIGERLGLLPISEDRLVLVDARDLDPAEADYLATAAVVRSTVDNLTASRLPAGPLILHIDLDVITPAELTGMRVPAPGGPSADAVLAAARRVLGTGRVVALDLACTWLPGGQDPTGLRSRLLAELLG